MHPRACHHVAHNISKQDRPTCVLGTFLYGSSQAWDALLPLYSTRLGQLAESRREWAPRGLKKLCADQDLLTDLYRSEPSRFDSFVTKDNWGWRDPYPDPRTNGHQASLTNELATTNARHAGELARASAQPRRPALVSGRRSSPASDRRRHLPW